MPWGHTLDFKVWFFFYKYSVLENQMNGVGTLLWMVIDCEQDDDGLFCGFADRVSVVL